MERLALPRSSATRGFGLLALLPLGPLSRAALQDEDAEESATGRALRAERAAPTKGSSPASRRLRCVGAEGSFPAPLSGPLGSWRLFSGLGRAGVRPGPARPLLPRLRPAQLPPRPPLLLARRHPPAGPCSAPLTRARRPTPCRRRRRHPRTPLGLRERDRREPQPPPPPLSPRSPHALPGCAALSPLLSLPPPPPPPPSPPPPSSAELPRPRRDQSEATELRR